jgi:hypothetical protein
MGEWEKRKKEKKKYVCIHTTHLSETWYLFNYFITPLTVHKVFVTAHLFRQSFCSCTFFCFSFLNEGFVASFSYSYSFIFVNTGIYDPRTQLFLFRTDMVKGLKKANKCNSSIVQRFEIFYDRALGHLFLLLLRPFVSLSLSVDT